jgi:hypothetical protein
MDSDEKAFDFAQELCKQLITLATSLIALTITFWKDVIAPQQVHSPSLAYWSWYALLASVFCGIWMLMALTGVLAPTNAAAGRKPSIRASSVVIPSALQILAFIAGLLLMVMFGQANYA